MKSIHEYSVKDLEGNEVDLEKYKGKVLLVVNTATQCGFTPQLKEMEALYQEYKDQGVEVLAFPSNDFAGQEPLDGSEIQDFCELNFKTSFPIFDKMHVKGSKQSELYQFLSNKSENGKVNSTPKWNFHKYLIDKKGQVVDFYYSITKPNASKVKKAIDKLLEE
ncbi:MAG: glutathione peroxidase [Bacteroidota bacterium]